MMRKLACLVGYVNCCEDMSLSYRLARSRAIHGCLSAAPKYVCCDKVITKTQVPVALGADADTLPASIV